MDLQACCCRCNIFKLTCFTRWNQMIVMHGKRQSEREKRTHRPTKRSCFRWVQRIISFRCLDTSENRSSASRQSNEYRRRVLIWTRLSNVYLSFFCCCWWRQHGGVASSGGGDFPDDHLTLSSFLFGDLRVKSACTWSSLINLFLLFWNSRRSSNDVNRLWLVSVLITFGDDFGITLKAFDDSFSRIS